VRRALNGGALMVERSHTAGWLPQIYEPLRKLRDRVADWFAPKTDGAIAEDGYEISPALPGVPTDNVEILVRNGTLTIQQEKQFDRRSRGAPTSSPSANTAHLGVRSACPPTP
jgi:HSP20 family protein